MSDYLITMLVALVKVFQTYSACLLYSLICSKAQFAHGAHDDRSRSSRDSQAIERHRVSAKMTSAAEKDYRQGRSVNEWAGRCCAASRKPLSLSSSRQEAQ